MWWGHASRVYDAARAGKVAIVNPEELAQRRRGRAGEMDGLLRDLFDEAIKGQLGIRHGGMGMALVAVGGYGRQELSPFSDLDVVLMHDSSVDPALADAVAQRVWYPLWDRKINLDNSVRDTQQMIDAAAQDYRVATGMLDARPVAGDFNLVLPVRSLVLAAWRRNAKSRLAEVRQARLERIERSGWLSHAAVPDLKESGGGLRDGVTMRSLVATWLVDIPHAESEYLRTSLLDVRDALHEVTGKRSDRFSPEVIPEVARFLGYGAEELDLHTRHLGWRSAHLNALAWRKVDDILAGPKPRTQRRSGPQLIPISAGVAKLEDEIVLTADADVKDPELALRAAVGAVEEGVALSTTSARRIAGTLALLPEPWPSSARRLMVDFLASGSALVPVWDELDYCGVVERWLPEWSAIRLRGSSSPVHRFTVDRHMLEACVEASKRLRDVSRPDVLVVAALLHDIGKGVEGDHSEVGAPMAEAIALRWGFEPADAATVGLLVRWHLLLPTIATRRDIEDPETAANVAAVVGDVDTLDMLAAITESDARATNAAAWSTWRAGLILGLVAKVRAVLEGAAHEQDPLAYEGWPAHVEMPDYESLGADGFILQVETHHAG
ncbi:MAG: [protein-PII] uridylyltransferase [Nocardioidaceae bacterium]|nr:[protein-PII] uridylyltransferase [Nocardioidaceae bacterium]